MYNNQSPYHSGYHSGLGNPATSGSQTVYHRWDQPLMGIDPNANLIAAMNRLAAALEKLNERSESK
jgi:hypothetical protein